MLSGETALAASFLGDIAEHAQAAADHSRFVAQGSGSHVEQKAIRFTLVANVDLDIVHVFTADGPGQRQLIGREEGGGIRQIAAIAFRPLGGIHIRRTKPEDAFGGRVKQQELPCLVRHDHAGAHAAQDRLQDPGLATQRFFGACQVLGAFAQLHERLFESLRLFEDLVLVGGVQLL